MSFQQQLAIQDESLPRDESRNSLPKRKLGTLRTSIKTVDSPKYVFNATCNGVPQNICIGTRLEFEVIIQPQPQHSTTAIDPEVSLDSCVMTLVAQTSGPHPTHIEVLRQKQWAQRPSGPFSKDNGYCKVVDLGVLGHVPSTFNFADVSRSYKLRLEMQFHAANRTAVMRHECPVIFQPPESPLRHEAGMRDLLSRSLPTYEEATAARCRNDSLH